MFCRYGASDFDGYGGYSDDNYFYFGDEYDNYYDMYGFDANGYGYDYMSLEMPTTDCQEDGTGEVKLSGVPEAAELVAWIERCLFWFWKPIDASN